MTLGVFTTSIMGMNAQAHAMGQISTNVANVNTVGYKRAETLFETKMSIYSHASQDKNSYSAGVVDRRQIDVAGQLSETGSIYNLALNGQGFFIVDNGRDTYYSRAGDFMTTAVAPRGAEPQQVEVYQPQGNGVLTKSASAAYLINSSGFYVQGWNADINGNFSNTLKPVIVSPSEYYPGHETTVMQLKANINATAMDEQQVISFPVYDSSYVAKSARMMFDHVPNADTWDVKMNIEGAAFVELNPPQVRFNEGAKMTSPEDKKITATVTWEDGKTSTFTMDVANVTQYAAVTQGSVLSQDGYPYGNFTDFVWDANGVLSANYDNGKRVAVCKVAVAQVQVPNNMEAISGNMFVYSRDCGNLSVVDLEETDASVQVSGGWLEKSNVALEDEFSKMIITQRAYSSNTQTFTTINEMTQEAISILS